MNHESNIFSVCDAYLHLTASLSSGTNSVSKRVEIVERTNGCAMIKQMRSIFSQSPILAS